MEKLNNVDTVKIYEYQEILKVLRETLSNDDSADIRLNSPTLRTMSGYTEQSNQKNFNPQVKKYLDKLAFDIEKEKAKDDEEAIEGISEEIMDMAGYIKDSQIYKSGRINEYAKSFVDRKLVEGKFDRLYDAIKDNDEDTIKKMYEDIYNMTSYSKKRPFGVVNQYAQTFVDVRINEFIERGIHNPNKDIKYL